MSVGEVEQLQRHALLVGGHAEGGQEEVDEARVAGALVVAGELGGDCGIGKQGRWRRCRKALCWLRGGRGGRAVGLGVHGWMREGERLDEVEERAGLSWRRRRLFVLMPTGPTL